MTATLDAGDFTADGALPCCPTTPSPTSAIGTGRIDQAALTALITGAPVKTL